jgi:phage shock protein E
MINFIKELIGLGPKINYAELVKNGAQMIDVRSQGEFSGGNIKGSINIPLQSITGSFSKIKKDKPVIVFCASGMRSASAKAILKANGYGEVHNAGSWISLNNKL